MEPIDVPSNEGIDRRDGVSGTVEHFAAESGSTEPMTVPGNEVINLCESEDDISDIVEEIVKDCETVKIQQRSFGVLRTKL